MNSLVSNGSQCNCRKRFAVNQGRLLVDVRSSYKYGSMVNHRLKSIPALCLQPVCCIGYCYIWQTAHLLADHMHALGCRKRSMSDWPSKGRSRNRWLSHLSNWRDSKCRLFVEWPIKNDDVLLPWFFFRLDVVTIDCLNLRMLFKLCQLTLHGTAGNKDGSDSCTRDQMRQIVHDPSRLPESKLH